MVFLLNMTSVDEAHELLEKLPLGAAKKMTFDLLQNVGFSLQIENIELNHASAITLGLILNEAITNAIKYAFPKGQEGKITISLTHIFQDKRAVVDRTRMFKLEFL